MVADCLDRLDVSTIDDETALAGVVECEKLVAFAHAVQLRLLARLARSRPASDPGRSFSEYATDEIAPAVAWTRNTAAGQIAHAVTMTRRLPAALDALQRGQVDTAAPTYKPPTALADHIRARDLITCTNRK